MTKNAVVSPQIPMTNEYVAKNTGEILNTGVDLSINWHDKIGDWSYYVGANLSYLHNEVKKLDGGLNLIRGGKTVQMVGEKMNSYYGYKVAGVYQNQAEIDADPIALANGLEPGDLRYEDVNGDKKIDGLDKQVLGSYVPDFTYGFNVGFSYKNFDFALTTYGQVGGEIWSRKRELRYASNFYNFDLDTYENRHGEGTSNTHPSAKGLTKGRNVSDSNRSSYYVEKSDYFRIQNITVGLLVQEREIRQLHHAGHPPEPDRRPSVLDIQGQQLHAGSFRPGRMGYRSISFDSDLHIRCSTRFLIRKPIKKQNNEII